MAETVDVAIVGGGMVGASLAIALAKACPALEILVLEAVDMPDPGSEPVYQPSYDARSTALSYGSRRIYEQLGLWQTLRQHLTQIERIHVSDRGSFGVTRLNAHDYRLDALGYVIENQWLGRVLWAELGRYPNIRFQCPVQVKTVSEQVQGVRLELEVSGEAEAVEHVQAQLAVLADGGRSGLRQQLGVPLESKAYDQAALVTNVSLDRHHQFVAYERFTDTGPMALLPLSDGALQDSRCALVWTLPSNEAHKLVEAPDDGFLEALHERFGHRAGAFVRVGARQLYPLVLERAVEQVRPGLVLVGNAAHVLHPVAGQGYNLALREVVGLAELLAGAAQAHRPLGDLSTLRDFESQQLLDQERTVQFSDHLVRIFSNQQLPWVATRGIGLVTLDLVGPLKQTFARYAMGMGDREASLG